MTIISWQNAQAIAAHDYQCGYCGNKVASEKGMSGNVVGGSQQQVFAHICPRCFRVSFIDVDGKVTPGSVFGNAVSDIPDEPLVKLYDEARNAMAVNGYTAAVLCCRKILMHIAVNKGAKESKPFIEYVTYLADNHYVSPDAKDWVDHIRTKGNEANHEIQIMVKDDAELLLTFVEMLLKTIYEFPATVKRKIPPPASP